MEVIRNLRPLEALYLLDHARQEMMDEESFLDTMTVYLLNEGYIDAIGHSVTMTDKGKSSRKGLRPYEIYFMEAAERQGSTEGLFSRNGFFIDFIRQSIRQSLVDRGYFLKVQTRYLPTQKYKQAMQDLYRLKRNILAGDTRDTFQISYAFPSCRGVFADIFT